METPARFPSRIRIDVAHRRGESSHEGHASEAARANHTGRARWATPVGVLKSLECAHLQDPRLMDLQLHLRDLSSALVAAWRGEFAGFAEVTVSQGDIFSIKSGPLKHGDPIDVEADAVISPANSFGFMDGGIDAVYTYELGPQVQDRLQQVLREEHHGELPVGQAVIVPTGNSVIPWCVSAPTMRVPMDVSNTANAFLAFRAALVAVIAHNRGGASPIRRLLSPGLATAVGHMPVARCALQMRTAWTRVIRGERFHPPSLGHAFDDDVSMRGSGEG